MNELDAGRLNVIVLLETIPFEIVAVCPYALETVAAIPEATFVPTTQIALLASEKPALLIAGGVILAGITSDARVEATPSVTT